MKSRRLFKASTLLVFLLVLVTVLAACTAPVVPAAPAAPAAGAGAAAAPAAAAAKSCIFIPKSLGNPWFISMQKGFDDFAAQSGGVKFTTLGADNTDPAAQVRMIEDAIAKKPDCIVVVPNDTAAVEPALKKGTEAGILMLTQESPTVQNAAADIEFLILEKEGKDVFDLLVKHAGESGGYAIMVGGLTTEGHMARADASVAYQEANFPNWKQVADRLEGSENAATAHDKTLELLTAHPDINGIIYIGSQGAIGGAQAVAEKGLAGKIAIIGESVPSQAKKYLEDGSMTANYIGNPYRIGLDSAYIVQELLAGKQLADLTTLPSYGEAQVDGKVITFHADTEVTAENADSFGF